MVTFEFVILSMNMHVRIKSVGSSRDAIILFLPNLEWDGCGMYKNIISRAQPSGLMTMDYTTPLHFIN